MTARSEVVTFGCRLNILESSMLRQRLDAANNPALAVVNSCAVTSEAVRQARQAVRRLKREAPDRPVVVTGCAAQIEPGTFAAMPEVSGVVGNARKFFPDSWSIGTDQATIEIAGVDAPLEAGGAVAMIEGQSRGLVRIQTGCDHACTFCIIPAGRGRSRSVTIPAVVEAVRALVEGGHREVVLTGVDITAWGLDLGGEQRLGDLVAGVLLEVPSLDRLRLSSVDSVEIDSRLIDLFAQDSRLMPHLHLSLQSGDDLILKRMKRRHSRADAMAFCERLRRLRPEIAFGADIIAGFPTESDDAFENSRRVIADCGLSYVHVFPYSPRPGTPATRMPQIAPLVVRERAAILRADGEVALHRHLDGQIGRRLTILTERGGMGRAPDFTPVAINRDVAPGQLLDVTINGRTGNRLTANGIRSSAIRTSFAA